MEAQIRNGNLVIVLPLEEPLPSASKKIRVVAGTRGVRRTRLQIDGVDVCVNANAFIYVDSVEKRKSKATAVSRHKVRNF